MNQFTAFLSYFFFLLLISLQIFATSLYGNQITLESEKLSESLFNSIQNQQTTKFKTSMIIFMENLKKPIKVQAFEVFSIDLENFLKIINMAYSLFAVLKSLKNKPEF
jgi:hypothetical protein